MTPNRPALPFAAALFGAGLLLPGAACADSIDGNWCTETGMRMTIQGSSLLSPGGAR